MLEKHGAAPPMIVDYDGEWLAQEIRHHILRSYPFFFFLQPHIYIWCYQRCTLWFIIPDARMISIQQSPLCSSPGQPVKLQALIH